MTTRKTLVLGSGSILIAVCLGISLILVINKNNTDEDDRFLQTSALFEYVHAEDGYFQWTRRSWEPDFDSMTILNKVEDPPVIKLLRLQSQSWSNSSYVSQSIWQHNVFICVSSDFQV